MPAAIIPIIDPKGRRKPINAKSEALAATDVSRSLSPPAMHFSGRRLLRMEGDATREIALCLLFGVQFLNADGHLHRIRHYGLFANGKNRAPNIARARQLLAVPQNTAQLNIDPNAESDQPRALPKPCPCCGGRLIIIEAFARGLPTQARSGSDQDRHLMMPSLLINDCNRSRRRSPAMPALAPSRQSCLLTRRKRRHATRR